MRPGAPYGYSQYSTGDPHVFPSGHHASLPSEPSKQEYVQRPSGQALSLIPPVPSTLHIPTSIEQSAPNMSNAKQVVMGAQTRAGMVGVFRDSHAMPFAGDAAVSQERRHTKCAEPVRS